MLPLLTSHIVTFPTAPNVEISENGDIVVTKVLREGVRKLEAYVEKMSSSDAVNTLINVDKVHASVLKLWNVVQSQPGISEEQVSRIKDLYDSVINSLRGRRVLPRIPKMPTLAHPLIKLPAGRCQM